MVADSSKFKRPTYESPSSMADHDDVAVFNCLKCNICRILVEWCLLFQETAVAGIYGANGFAVFLPCCSYRNQKLVVD